MVARWLTRVTPWRVSCKLTQSCRDICINYSIQLQMFQYIYIYIYVYIYIYMYSIYKIFMVKMCIASILTYEWAKVKCKYANGNHIYLKTTKITFSSVTIYVTFGIRLRLLGKTWKCLVTRWIFQNKCSNMCRITY